MPLLSKLAGAARNIFSHSKAFTSTTGKALGEISEGSFALRTAGRMGRGIVRGGEFMARDAGRVMYRSGVGTFHAWRKLPPTTRRGIIVGGVVLATGISTTHGLISGFREGFMGPEDMYNRAHGYGTFGDEKYFRNKGRMPSNHLGHAGIGLSMSRLRHG